MEILLQVRHNYHQGIPTFESTATNWEQANCQLTEGLELIRCKNQFYIDRFESYNAIVCGIIDFVLKNEKGTSKGQFGFNINRMDKSIKEMIEWYLGFEHSTKNVG